MFREIYDLNKKSPRYFWVPPRTMFRTRRKFEIRNSKFVESVKLSI